MSEIMNTLRQTWRSAQLYIGFHRDQKGARRSQPKVWPPKNANASIHSDPSEQEAFVVVKSAQGDPEQDVQIKLRSDKIVLRRDFQDAWNGVLVTEDFVTVAVAGISIRINHDGSITRESGTDTTWVEADGSVLKKTEFAEASISADGIDLKRRTSDSIAAVGKDGVIAKPR
ncbi:hypothetical protein [Leisingera sp. ANG-M1]|uniref:hypothetical protein n=1 Tax=Leisingera sp. ANG-M1 TaxID=1577895 RepID=UPI000A668FC9|nr:hypothetical protein [Leisingera sp. ANG-M1]